MQGVPYTDPKTLRVAKGKADHYKKALVNRLAKKIRHLTYTAGYYRDKPIAEFLKRSIKINQIENKPYVITQKRNSL